MTDLKHSSDCALHNMPAMPAGPCDCGLEERLRAKLRAAMRVVEAAEYDYGLRTYRDPLLVPEALADFRKEYPDV